VEDQVVLGISSGFAGLGKAFVLYKESKRMPMIKKTDNPTMGLYFWRAASFFNSI
jgi:hypothetical protein